MTYHKIGLAQGEGHYRSKLTVGEVMAIYISPSKLDYLATVYHVHISTIQRIKTGKSWAHLTRELDKLG